MLRVQEFLMANPTNWRELLMAPPYSLKIKDKGNLVLFKYDQISSDFNYEICRECRGLILEKGTWRVVRAAFNKFFNIDESFADKIDWDSAAASQKEDGSLISLYYYDGWHIATNSSIDAYDAELNSVVYKNFGELAAAAFEKYGLDFKSLNPNYTYTMELCSSFNKVVLSYPELTLFHILTRDNTTLEEVEVNIGVPKPAQYKFNSESDYRKLVANFGDNTEGIVVRDRYNHRVKIKTQLYFQLHKLANNGSVKIEEIVELIQKNDDAEFLSYFPEYQSYFDFVRAKLNQLPTLIKEIEDFVSNFKKSAPAAPRKEFALRVKDLSNSDLYFKAYDNKLDPEFSVPQLIKILHLTEN